MFGSLFSLSVTRRQRRLQQAPATGDSPPPVRNVPPEGEVPEAQPTCDCDDDDSDLVCGWEGWHFVIALDLSSFVFPASRRQKGPGLVSSVWFCVRGYVTI